LKPIVVPFNVLQNKELIVLTYSIPINLSFPLKIITFNIEAAHENAQRHRQLSCHELNEQ
jgi:hypothetical protein